MGQVSGVIVGLESTGDKDVLTALGKQLAMHIANTNPLSVSPDDIDPAVVAKEREIFAEQAKESGKPAEVVAKMVEGRVRKFFEEVDASGADLRDRRREQGRPTSSRTPKRTPARRSR